jgi:hypothetical protein
MLSLLVESLRMAIFTFQIEDSKSPSYGPVLVEFDDINQVRDEAIAVLAGLAKDALPDGDAHDFTAIVRDSNGVALFEATLSLRSRWL